jgi:tetratricopeptide (TPR) repeat protein
VRSLGLKSRTEWKAYCKSGDKPEDIPANPDSTYADAGWTGFGDWLGKDLVAEKEISIASAEPSHAVISDIAVTLTPVVVVELPASEIILPPPDHLARGEAFAKDGKLDEAIAEFTSGIEQNGSDARLFVWRGNVHTKTGRVVEAIADYDAAIAIDPHNSRALCARGWLLAAGGRLDRAIADYDAAIAIDPDYKRAIERRAEAVAQRNALDDDFTNESTPLRPM